MELERDPRQERCLAPWVPTISTMNFLSLPGLQGGLRSMAEEPRVTWI